MLTKLFKRNVHIGEVGCVVAVLLYRVDDLIPSISTLAIVNPIDIVGHKLDLIDSPTHLWQPLLSHIKQLLYDAKLELSPFQFPRHTHTHTTHEPSYSAFVVPS